MTVELLTEQSTTTTQPQPQKGPRGGLLALATLYRNASSAKAIAKQDTDHFAVTKQTKQIPQRISSIYELIKTFSSRFDAVVSTLDSRAEGISKGEDYVQELSKLNRIIDSEHISPYLQDTYNTLIKQAGSSGWKKKARNDPSLQESIDNTLSLLESTLQKINAFKTICSSYETSYIAEQAFFYDKEHTFFQGHAPSLSQAYLISQTMEHALLQTLQDKWFSRTGSPVTREDIQQTKEIQKAQHLLYYEVGSSVFYEKRIEQGPIDLINTSTNKQLYQTLTGKSFGRLLGNLPFTGFDVSISQADDSTTREKHIRKQTRQSLDKIVTTNYQTSVIRGIGGKDKETRVQLQDSLSDLVTLFQKQFYSETGTKRNSAYMSVLEAEFNEAGLDESKQEGMTLFSFAYYLRHHESSQKRLVEGTAVDHKKILAEYTAYTIRNHIALVNKYDTADIQSYINSKKRETITDDSIDFLRMYNHIHILSENAYQKGKKKATILFSAKDINPK